MFCRTFWPLLLLLGLVASVQAAEETKPWHILKVAKAGNLFVQDPDNDGTGPQKYLFVTLRSSRPMI